MQFCVCIPYIVSWKWIIERTQLEWIQLSYILCIHVGNTRYPQTRSQCKAFSVDTDTTHKAKLIKRNPSGKRDKGQNMINSTAIFYRKSMSLHNICYYKFLSRSAMEFKLFVTQYSMILSQYPYSSWRETCSFHRQFILFSHFIMKQKAKVDFGYLFEKNWWP